jgi:glycosyltransferase involved in cell wall biosynthesis
MRLLMVSGDRQAAVGEGGPFHAMLKEFSRHFERIDVLCPRLPGEIRCPVLFDSVHLHPALCSRLTMAAYVARRGKELVEAHAHELIVSHDYGFFYNGFGAARLSEETGVPYVSEIHHVPGHPVAANSLERCERALARVYLHWARDRARAFRVVNHVEMPELLQRWGVPQEKILVLPSLYIDLATFTPPSLPRETSWDVVFVGRLVANKGLDRIAGALGEARRRGHRWRALFVGKGPMAEELLLRIRREGIAEQVDFLGWVQSPAELADIYRRTRVVVCASTAEGGPRFTVEAMACGTPVVSTPVGMMAEILPEGGGALCGFDQESLVGALEGVLCDEAARRRMGKVAHAIAQRFEHRAAIANYARGLQALVGAGERA